MGNLLCRDNKNNKKIIIKEETNKIELSDEEKVIDEIVERYLERCNLPLIPDFVEKKIYKNILKIIISVIEDTLEKTEIQVLGHKIKFTIEPIKEQDQQQQHSNNNDESSRHLKAEIDKILNSESNNAMIQ